MIATLIFLVICMHSRLTKLLENSAHYAKYDSKEKLCGRCTGLDLGDSAKHEEIFAINDDHKNEVEDLRVKNR